MIRFAIALAALLAASPTVAAEPRTLRVCADPNNLPFSNEAGEGFENRIVELVARELNAEVSYVWWAQRRGFVRNTLDAGLCDLVPGIATGVETMATTRPYYRSTYVFLSRTNRGLDISSFDDPRLRTATVGVQMVGDDFSNTPPAHALAERGIVENVRGYMLYGDYAEPSPPQRIVEAVAEAEVDVAVVWGPLAGYFGRRAREPLTLSPVSASEGSARWPMEFDISMGVRRSDRELLQRVDTALARLSREIDTILEGYSVPRTAPRQAAP